MRFKFKIKKVNPLKSVSSFFRKRKGLILLFIFLGLTGYSMFLWYIFIYNSEWSENSRNDYMNSKEFDVVFSNSKFEKMIQEIDSRLQRSQENIDNVEDVFRLKK